MKNPLISVIIPCYNHGNYLSEAIQSIIDQSFSNWECIIINDGSEDNTAQIAENWEKKDSRFKYLNQKNGGASSARNLGLKNASGEFIQFLDADDSIDEKKLKLTIKKILENPEASIYMSEDLYITKYAPKSKEEYLQEVSLLSIISNWRINYIIPIHAAIFNRKYCAGLFFDEKLQGAEDWLWWIEVLLKKDHIIVVNSPLLHYRITKGNTVQNFFKMEKNFIQANKKVLSLLTNDNTKNIMIDNTYTYWEYGISTQQQVIEYYKKSKIHILAEKIISVYYKFRKIISR